MLIEQGKRSRESSEESGASASKRQLIGTVEANSRLNPKDPIAVTQELVRIPSHPEAKERKIGRWIEGFIKKHAPSGFKTQFLETDQPDRARATLIAYNNPFPKLVILGHI